MPYDAIIVPGGGVTAQGTPVPCVDERLLAACDIPGEAPIVCLSAGTTNRPPPLDHNNFPVFEATAGAIYLRDRGVNPARLFCENVSYDTIANAFFLRVIHAELRNWRKLLIINSEFHMQRTKAIFDVMFKLPYLVGQTTNYELTYQTVKNTGLTDEELTIRRQKESKATQHWQETVNRKKFQSLADVQHWLFSEHAAYAFARTPQRITGPLLQTY